MNDAARALLDLMLEAGRRSTEVNGRCEHSVGYLAGDRPLLTALFRYTQRDYDRINRLLGALGRAIDADTILVVAEYRDVIHVDDADGTHPELVESLAVTVVYPDGSDGWKQPLARGDDGVTFTTRDDLPAGDNEAQVAAIRAGLNGRPGSPKPSLRGVARNLSAIFGRFPMQPLDDSIDVYVDAGGH